MINTHEPPFIVNPFFNHVTGNDEKSTKSRPVDLILNTEYIQQGRFNRDLEDLNV